MHGRVQYWCKATACYNYMYKYKLRPARVDAFVIILYSREGPMETRREWEAFRPGWPGHPVRRPLRVGSCPSMTMSIGESMGSFPYTRVCNCLLPCAIHKFSTMIGYFSVWKLSVQTERETGLRSIPPKRKNRSPFLPTHCEWQFPSRRVVNQRISSKKSRNIGEVCIMRQSTESVALGGRIHCLSLRPARSRNVSSTGKRIKTVLQVKVFLLKITFRP